MTIDHDRNFKNVILEYMRPSLEFFAAEEAAKLPPDARILPIRQEQLQKRLGGSFKILDTPLKVEFPDGSSEAIFFVIEEDSRPRGDWLINLATYCLELARLYKTRRVVPVVIHPFRKKPVTAKLALSGQCGSYLEFHCVCCTLGSMEAAAFAGSNNPVAQLCMPLMKYDLSNKVDVIGHSLARYCKLEKDSTKRSKYLQFITDYAPFDDQDWDDLREKNIDLDPWKEDTVSLTEVLMNKGRDKGLVEGRVEGRVEGLAQGAVRTIQNLHRDGVLTLQQAQASLRALVKNGEATKTLVDSALKTLEFKNSKKK